MAIEQREHSTGAPSLPRMVLPWTAAALWMAGISWLSSQPDSSLPDIWRFAYHDKAEHFGFYLVLGVLVCWALWASVQAPGRALLWSLAIGALFGASDEAHQLFVPTRHGELGDWTVDVAGVAIGAIAFWLIWGSSRRRRRGASNVIDR
jgi:hypothetical protein